MRQSGRAVTGEAGREKRRILFLCTGNSCRSQMAEGWCRALRGDRYEVFSAGTAPHGIDPLAVEAMREVGVDISSHRSRSVEEFLPLRFDLVVTVCGNAEQNCPVFPGDAERLHRGFDDPPAEARQIAAEGEDWESQLAPYRRVREEIREMVLALP